MSLRKIWNRIKGVKEKAEEVVVIPSPERVGYFNGLCPNCGEHIGTYLWKRYYGRVRRESKMSVVCGVCGSEIYEQVKEKVELGRI